MDLEAAEQRAKEYERQGLQHTYVMGLLCVALTSVRPQQCVAGIGCHVQLSGMHDLPKICTLLPI